MKRPRVFALVGVFGVVATLAAASAQKVLPTPYKLGTFAQGNRTFLGLVLNDTIVLDLSKANSSVPSDMKALLQRFDELAPALATLAASAAASAAKPANAYQVSALKTLPPVMPANMLNAAVNYTEHAMEMAGQRS